MQISGYLKTSLIEWPGMISSVIFSPGCNFHCPFCHNPDLVDSDKIKELPLLDQEEVLANIKERKKWIDAVVITGGEPTIQTDLSEFLSRLKKLGFLTMVHTNGTRPEVLKELLATRSPQGRSVDYFCLDLKGDFENYEKYCNVKTQISNVKTSIKEIIKSGVEYEFRTTVVPGLHNKKNLILLANEVNELFKNLKLEIKNCRWYLQQFSPKNCLDPKFKKLEPYSGKDLESFQKELKKIIPNTYLRGVVV